MDKRKDGNYIAEEWGFGVYNLEELHLDTSNKSKVSSLIFLVMFYLKHSRFECCAWSHNLFGIQSTLTIKSSLFEKQQKPSGPKISVNSMAFLLSFCYSNMQYFI